jgi:Holliday junction DNA helicase RuvA
MRTAWAMKSTCRWHTHLVVREDAQLLYGFGSEAERVSFRQLIKITGVGAKMALAVLSGLNANELAQAVAMQDTGRLTKIPGVGKKTAERLLLELKGKLADALPGAALGSVTETSSDVLNALLALGYNEREANHAVRQLAAGTGVADGIRQALKVLSKT